MQSVGYFRAALFAFLGPKRRSGVPSLRMGVPMPAFAFGGIVFAFVFVVAVRFIAVFAKVDSPSMFHPARDATGDSVIAISCAANFRHSAST